MTIQKQDFLITICVQFFYLTDLILKPNEKEMIKANDINGKESGLRALTLKFKRWIEGPAQNNVKIMRRFSLLKINGLFRHCPLKDGISRLSNVQKWPEASLFLVKKNVGI